MMHTVMCSWAERAAFGVDMALIQGAEDAHILLQLLALDRQNFELSLIILYD